VSGPENTWIVGMHKHLPDHLYRMKNHNQYNSGIADVWYSGSCRDLWVEYKFVEVPKRDDTIVVPGLSRLQAAWLASRASEGRNVAVIVGCKEGGVILHSSQWEGLPAKTFRESILTRKLTAGHIVNFVNSCTTTL
jgi:hypothetical protein